jgi:hypothetical protein
MPQTLDDLIAKFDNLPSKMDEFIFTELETTAKDFIALQVTKVRREGIGSYSTKKVPAFFFYGKQINAAGITFLRAHGVRPKGDKLRGTGSNPLIGKGRYGKALTKDQRLTNWGEFRQAQGLQSAFVDATYTTRTLNQLGVFDRGKSGFKYTLGVSGITDYSFKIFGYLGKRYPNFFFPSKEIQDILGKVTALRVGTKVGEALGLKFG